MFDKRGAIFVSEFRDLEVNQNGNFIHLIEKCRKTNV